MIHFVDLNKQHLEIQEELDDAYRRVVKSSRFILGPEVEAFENEFAGYLDARYAIGVDSGTTALKLALLAAGIDQGDEVIVPALTFIATALSVSEVGAVPVFVDIDPDSYLIKPANIKNVITDRTKAIIPVHLYGQPASIDEILEIAKEYKLTVIEDACQAHGAIYKNRRVGALGNLGCFSFYPGKNLGALGDGGMVVTNSDIYADKLKMLRNYGQRKKYHHEILGFNHRLDEIQAAWLRVKLKRLDKWNNVRIEIAKWYSELLNNDEIKLPQKVDYGSQILEGSHVYHLFVIRHKKREELQKILKQEKIESGIHYPVPVHLLEAYKYLQYNEGSMPNAENACKEILSLPMHPYLTKADINKVANTISKFLFENKNIITKLH